MLFKKYKGLFGNSLKYMIFTYGIHRDIIRSLQIIFKIPVYTIYGETYTTGIAFIGTKTPAEKSDCYNELLPSLGKDKNTNFYWKDLHVCLCNKSIWS